MFLPNPKRRERPDPATIREIYIDETSQTKHRYLLMGALCAPLLNRDAAIAAIKGARLPNLPHGEMKWGKVSIGKFSAYQRVIDAFFTDLSFNMAHFHCLIVDTTMLDDNRFNDGNREIGFNKEIYQAASKCARLYRNNVFHLYPDNRDTKQRPERLREILNNGRRKVGDGRDFPFRRCQFRDSKQTPQLQLVDILLGAVAYHVNGHAHQDLASAAKRKLSNYVLDSAGVHDVTIDTAKAGKFTIWHRRLRKTGVPRA
jgi:hypothetical protein